MPFEWSFSGVEMCHETNGIKNLLLNFCYKNFVSMQNSVFIIYSSVWPGWKMNETWEKLANYNQYISIYILNLKYLDIV